MRTMYLSKKQKKQWRKKPDDLILKRLQSACPKIPWTKVKRKKKKINLCKGKDVHITTKYIRRCRLRQ